MMLVQPASLAFSLNKKQVRPQYPETPHPGRRRRTTGDASELDELSAGKGPWRLKKNSPRDGTHSPSSATEVAFWHTPKIAAPNAVAPAAPKAQDFFVCVYICRTSRSERTMRRPTPQSCAFSLFLFLLDKRKGQYPREPIPFVRAGIWKREPNDAERLQFLGEIFFPGMKGQT